MVCVNAYPVFVYGLQCKMELGVVCIPVGFRLKGRVWPFQQHSQWSFLPSYHYSFQLKVQVVG